MVINFKPSPKQFLAWKYLTDNITTEIGYGGSAHSGKSYLGCFFILSMCLAYPDTGWVLGRKELINLKKTTLLTFFKVCDEFGIKSGEHFNYNQQENIITFTNKSQIFLFDLAYKPTDPLYTRLGGLEVTGAFIDESNECPGGAINILSTRLGRRKNEEYGLTAKLLEGFNPDKAHVYARYYKPWRDGTLPKYRQFIKALPSDNPYTTEEYLNQLRASDKITIERLLNGNFEYDDDPTALIEYDAILDLFTNTVEDGGGYISSDVARFGKDSTTIMTWKGLRMIAVKEWQKQDTAVTTSKIGIEAQEQQIPRSHIVVDCDGVGGGVADGLPGCFNFIANSTPIELVRGKPENYQNLKAQCAYKLAELINGRKMRVDCHDNLIKEKIIQELEQIKSFDADKDGKLKILPKDKVKEIIGRSPDFSDCMLMRMVYEIRPNSEPRPVRQFIPNTKTYSQRVPQGI